MDLRNSAAIIFLAFGCLMVLATADPDCENLKDRREEIQQCCEVGKIIPLDGADDCTPSDDEDLNKHEKIMCPLVCKLQSLGVLKDDEIVQEKVNEYVERLEDGWKDIAKGITNVCIENVNAMREKMKEHAQGRRMKCSPVGGMFFMCLMKETLEKCPEDKRKDSSFCKKLQNGECRRGQ
uniref:Uncharacterized protein n=1 Tax=Anopheles epiroticus TaxID=199890 RepID=A0A9I3FGJ0_9DIPT